MPFRSHPGLSLLSPSRLSLLAALLLSALPGTAHSQAGLFKPDPHLYSETANPSTDIAVAIARARREHKRILLDFGGNWCSDCQVLDLYYHQSPNAELLEKHYILVHIDIGHMDHNLNIARRYNVPVTKGVPALAILDSSGKLLYSEREKEFEQPSPAAITALLTRWKA